MLKRQVIQICRKYATAGWAAVFAPHGLDLANPDFAKPLTIQRAFGFEDFSVDGVRAIEPGQPSLSLLYHGFASPKVLQVPHGAQLRQFPTLAELGVVEDFVFSRAKRSLASLKAQFGNDLACVVFAYEYRAAAETCHRRFADLCFSRTGVARVGTENPRYKSDRRGFIPQDDTDAKAIRALPARYAPFLAVRRKGSATQDFALMQADVDADPQDSDRDFWIPVHKLFAGSECLTDVADAAPELAAEHCNEKIRRVHLALAAQGNTGWAEPDISQPPFRQTDNIAAFSTDPDFGPGLLVPESHPLVEPAVYKGQPLYFTIPAKHPHFPPPDRGWFSSSLEIVARGAFRHGPEYVNARHRLVNGKEVNLNQAKSLAVELNKFQNPCRHYLDWTGDGFITLLREGVWKNLNIPVMPAYSLVTAPDFFPFASQRGLTEWAAQLPKDLKATVWSTPPDVLSDQRLAANLQLPQSPFQAQDDSFPAVVSLLGVPNAPKGLATGEALRHSHLPDDSAGVFAPGWDVSQDKFKGTAHMAAYGLGSPFPEDAKLCASLSSFWPGASPDATRTYSPFATNITVAPLTDEEIARPGSGRLPWDGIPGPVEVKAAKAGVASAEYAAFERVDYVDSALAGQFTLSLTSHIDLEEYTNRVLTMARVYQAITGKIGKRVSSARKKAWLLLSFRVVTAGDQELIEAEKQGQLDGIIYRLEMIDARRFVPVANKPWRTRVPITKRTTFFAGVFAGGVPRVLMSAKPGIWKAVDF